MLNITQNDYNIIKQKNTERYIKLNLLDFNYNIVDELSGNMLSCSVRCDADSDLRRSCNVSFVVTDSGYEVGAGNRIWLNKYIQLYIGLKNIYTQEIQWYNQGIYLIDAPSYEYNATTHTLTFAGLDLMSKLTGARNGQLPGMPTVIKQGENVRKAIIATLALGGFTKYIVEECKVNNAIQPVPYDIQIDQGGYVFDILSKLRDILPKYQMYFDVNGVFHYEPIPSGEDDPILITDDIWDSVVTGETINTDFTTVKNYIEVYGRTHEVQYYDANPTFAFVAQVMWNLSFNIPAYQDSEYSLIGFTMPSTSGLPSGGIMRVSINGTFIGTLLISNKTLQANQYYVIQRIPANNRGDKFEFLGGLQAKSIWQDTNPESPFYVNGPVGIIREVLCGGEYENITSDDLAQQRAEIEGYWKCRLNDNITLNVVPVPWIDVNIVVSHAPKQGDVTNRYIIKSYSVDYGSVSSTMSITMITFYPYYPIL
nr:MAG TPA: protein of unknown function (DUF5048) [Caudoviricetes sp.]